MNDLIEQQLIDAEADKGYVALLRFLRGLYPQAKDPLIWIALFTFFEVRQGNVCTQLGLFSNAANAFRLPRKNLLTIEKAAADLPVSETSQNLFSTSSESPVVYLQQRFYLHRLYQNECLIGETLLRLAQVRQELQPQSLQLLNQLYPDPGFKMQQLAAWLSLRCRLLVLSGGPGTGKTHTVASILLLLAQTQADIRIELCAPTGKAAGRLTESIQRSLKHPLFAELASGLPLPAQANTLHRLLKMHRFSHKPCLNRKKPLNLDVLVIDEASMIDQQMMAFICDALPESARLILLGDHHQLASVEAGSVFADLCGGLEQTAFDLQQQQLVEQQLSIPVAETHADFALTDNLVILDKSRRFTSDSGIGRLSHLIRDGQADRVLSLFESQTPDLSISAYLQNTGGLPAEIINQVLDASLAMMHSESVTEALRWFERFKILAAVWEGPQGVHSINNQIENRIREKTALAAEQSLYQGKPVLVRQNYPELGLFNGDVGIVWPDQNGDLRICFVQSDASISSFSELQLAELQTAYALTVHQSQGSEFDRVAVLLPHEDVPVLTRELLYTAVTRARKHVSVSASPGILRNCIERKTRRMSGLPQLLNDQK